VQNRLQEIEDELARLDKHKSAVMMRHQEEAARKGRDWFAEVEAQLREDVARRQIERDVLETQLASMAEDEFEDTAVSNSDFADIILDATLDDPSFEAEISAEFDRYIHRRRSKNYFEEDFEDDYDFD
jgi:S-adenosylmethionine hydrolase